MVQPVPESLHSLQVFQEGAQHGRRDFRIVAGDTKDAHGQLGGIQEEKGIEGRHGLGRQLEKTRHILCPAKFTGKLMAGPQIASTSRPKSWFRQLRRPHTKDVFQPMGSGP